MNLNRHTVLNNLIRFWPYTRFTEGINRLLPLWVTQFIDVGAELQTIYPQDTFQRMPTLPYLGRLMTRVFAITEVTEFNDISLAVVRKSEADLRRALTVSPHTINETNTAGQTALHLAVDWSVGMHILLEARADVDCEDYHLLSPLDYAIQRSLIEPLSILGHADCSLFDLHLDSRRLVLEAAIHLEELGQLNQTPNTAAEMVVDLLVDLIIHRRQRLCDLAIRTLPASDLAHFYPHGDHDPYLLDESASQLSSALLYHSIPTPSALDPGRDRVTIYHQIEASSRVAEKLWKAGFRDIDGKGSSGLTPLIYMRTGHPHLGGSMNLVMECVAWFLDKGADFYATQDLALYSERRERKVPSGSRQLLSATSLHFVAYKLGWSLDTHINHGNASTKYTMPLKMRLSETSKQVFERVVMDNVIDGCTCACSINGCKAITLITKGYISHMGKYTGFQHLADLWADMIDICDPLKSSEFLRLMTFEKLGLTHTCCRPDCRDEWGTFPFSRIGDQAEIDDIHEEEAADMQKLKELLEEFEAKRVELDLPLLDFLEKYWSPRMVEVLSEGDLDEEALKELGVTVYESGSDFSVNSGS